MDLVVYLRIHVYNDVLMYVCVCGCMRVYVVCSRIYWSMYLFVHVFIQ